MTKLVFLCLFPLSLLANQYAIIVDAGSTGSRATIFEAGKRVEWKTSCEDDEAGGIQALAKHSDVERHLGSTVRCIKNKFQEWGQSKSLSKLKLSLMATGGVRSISPSAQKQVLKKVIKYFRQQGFKDVTAEVLSGEKEGLYAWIAVNYLSDTLGKPAEQTYGVLDMGGASTQIAFVPEKVPLKHRVPLRIAGRTYQLYIYSYDGLGVNFFARNQASRACFQKNIEKDKQVLKETGLGQKFFPALEATGNYEACKSEVLEYLKESCKNKSDCGLRDVYQPAPRGDFFAIAGYAHFTLKKATKKVELNPSELEEIGKTLCQKNWADYKATGLDKPKYLSTGCIEPAFYSALLFGHPNKTTSHNGFGFDPSKHKVRATFKINEMDVSWTLGAAVYMGLKK